MLACLTTASGNDNALHRHPGGFWMNQRGVGLSYGTKTVQALVARGLAEYTEWKDGRNGRFPIALKLT